MNDDQRKPRFLDLNQVQKSTSDMTGKKFEVDAKLFHDLFRHGEHHVSEYEWNDIARKCGEDDIGHYVLNSIRCMMNAFISSDNEINAGVIPLYRAAKNFSESKDSVAAGKLMSSLVKTLELYKNNAEPSPYVLEGIQWHKLAHLAIARRCGVDYTEIEGEYDIALGEIVARKRG